MALLEIGGQSPESSEARVDQARARVSDYIERHLKPAAGYAAFEPVPTPSSREAQVFLSDTSVLAEHRAAARFSVDGTEVAPGHIAVLRHLAETVVHPPEGAEA